MLNVFVSRLAWHTVMLALSQYLFLPMYNIIIINYRCVADEQRTLALGLQSLLFRAFGSIPGPIVFGVIIDSACLFWQFDCDRRGNCWVYNSESLGNRAMALALCGVAFNFSFSLLTWVAYPKSKTELNREVENNKSENPAEETMNMLHSETKQTSTAKNYHRVGRLYK